MNKRVSASLKVKIKKLKSESIARYSIPDSRPIKSTNELKGERLRISLLFDDSSIQEKCEYNKHPSITQLQNCNAPKTFFILPFDSIALMRKRNKNESEPLILILSTYAESFLIVKNKKTS